MKILILGSKGFIGSYCLQLLSKKYEVWGCDVMNDYVARRYFQVDATNADFKEVFQNQEFDACINCAGAASVPDSFIHPLRDFSLNTSLVARALEAIRLKRPNCKFINLSSAAVYGNPQALPIQEEALLQPMSPYGIHKKQAEELVREYVQFFGLIACSLRPFSVYGPGLRKQIFWDLHCKVQQSAHIDLWGTGEESRDFIFIEDLVSCIESVLLHGRFKGECINVGSGQETSIQEAVSVFQEVYYKAFSFSFGGQKREGDPINWQADVSILKSFGFISQHDLKQGLSYFVAWLQREKN